MRSRWQLLVAILLSTGIPAATQQFTGARLERGEIHPNLLPNASFESAPADGKPAGWQWNAGSTDSTCRMDSVIAHSGRRSLFFTSHTDFAPNVYGTLWSSSPIRIRQGGRYTLSAWYRSVDAGAAWIGGGGGWLLRIPLSRTGTEWKRVKRTFIASDADVEFTPRINIDSATPGLWVDDIKLEEGDPTPAEPAPGAAPALLLSTELVPASADGDGPFELAFPLFVPEGSAADQVEARFGSHRAVRYPIAAQPGAWTLRLLGDGSGATGRPESVQVRLLEGGRAVVQAETRLTLLSPRGASARLAALRARMPALERALRSRRARGEDTSYPRIPFTVLSNFVGYVEDDITGAHGRVKPQLERAGAQLDDLEAMATRLERSLASSTRFPAVPRWTGTARPAIVGPSFVGETETAGRREQRPIFFTGYGHFGQVVADLGKWPDYGTNIIQIELGPSSVFPTPDRVDMAPIEQMKRTLALAARERVAVCLLISPHYMPDWMLERYPDLKKRREGFLQYCLHAPEGMALMKRFIGLLIPAIMGSPALHSICLTNEPVNVEEPCEPGARLWRAWVAKRYTSVAELNRHWSSAYASFEAVPMPDLNHPPAPNPLWADFVRWNQEFFAGWHRELADEIHRFAPALPIHAKAMTWCFMSDPRYGVDAELFGGFSQINGNDSANNATPAGSEFAEEWQQNAESHDLQRSVLDAPIFNSENHIIPDRFTGYVAPAHIRAAIWQAAIHGQSATTVWVWERTFDPAGDLAGSIVTRPACAAALGVVSCDLNRAAREVTALQRGAPDVWILQSVGAATWDGSAYLDCDRKLYQALDLSGAKVGYVTERQLERGLSLQGRTLYVPNIVHLSEGAFQALIGAKSVRIVGDARSLSRNEVDRLRTEALPNQTRIPFQYGRTSARELWRTVAATLPARPGAPRVVAAEGLRPPQEASGQPAGGLQGAADPGGADRPWGVEWRTVAFGKGHLVNLYNTLGKAIRIRVLGGDGRPAPAMRDVLNGATLPAAITLQPMEVRLLLVP